MVIQCNISSKHVAIFVLWALANTCSVLCKFQTLLTTVYRQQIKSLYGLNNLWLLHVCGTPVLERLEIDILGSYMGWEYGERDKKNFYALVPSLSEDCPWLLLYTFVARYNEQSQMWFALTWKHSVCKWSQSIANIWSHVIICEVDLGR